MTYHIPTKYINKLAKANSIKYFGRDLNEVIEDIKEEHSYKLEYLEDIFQFSSKYITLLSPESNFPDKSSTPELFLRTLIEEEEITINQVNKSWQPQLSKKIKICAVKHVGSTVYIKFVIGKDSIKKNQWNKEKVLTPYIIPIAVDFQNRYIEIRCAKTELDKYKNHIMKIMGFVSPYKANHVPILTKKTAEALCRLLSAGITSSHIALPSTVGSVRFNGVRGVDLNKDETLSKIKKAFEKIGLPTNDTMDQEAVFTFKDPIVDIEFDIFMHVDILAGYFKFKEDVNESVLDHVKEALIRVTEQEADDENQTSLEIAANVVVKEVIEAETQVAFTNIGGQLTLDF